MACRLLLVEDEPEVRELVAEYLRGRGFDVTMCADGLSARTALVPDRFELLITDLRLPDIEGTDLIRAARALEPPLPSLVITGFATPTAILAAMRAGAVDLVVKPFRLPELRQAVEGALQAAATLREARFRDALLGWFERTSLASTPGSAEQCFEHLRDLLARYRPDVHFETAVVPLEDGDWHPLGERRCVRWERDVPGLSSWVLALHHALLRTQG